MQPYDFQRPGSIAIIGMAGRFPGADNLDTYWRNIEKGVESITFFSSEELIQEGVDPERVNEPDYVKAAPIIRDADRFDAAFFEYSPREAEVIDPSQRLFLELAWEALETAGYAGEQHGAEIGVFGGSGGVMNSYLLSNTHVHRSLIGATAGIEHVGNDKDYLCTRVSYKLNLKGPSLTVQTACSTSLVAVHMACQSLLNMECDIALAGGVNIRVPQKAGYLIHESPMHSPDGHCRSFDVKAAGTVFGSGAGIVVLKPLSRAAADGDLIHAVIRGSAINNDGLSKLSYWAASTSGLAAALSEAMVVAEVNPDTVEYVEAHGTGTELGDPVEVQALTQVFRQSTRQKGVCGLGSVKSNIGHLESASGVAGLIKTVLALKHKSIPPTVHFLEPNPKMNIEESPFYITNTSKAWITTQEVRRAVVNNLGIGGTNACLVLEELPESANRSVSVPSTQVLALSAKSKPALKELAVRYETHLRQHPEQSFGDIAFTANTGRAHFAHRLALSASSSAIVRKKIDAFIKGDRADGLYQQAINQEDVPKIAFLFAGQGGQYAGMGRRIYESCSVFRESLDHCSEIIQEELKQSLDRLLFEKSGKKSMLNETRYVQPALFAYEYSLAHQWQSWGITPDIVFGWGVGEIVAACVAGIFSVKDGLTLAAIRGRLIQEKTRPGLTASVFAGEAQVREILGETAGDMFIAALCGTNHLVITGEAKKIKPICDQLNRNGINSRKLKVSHPLHSPLLKPIQRILRKTAARISYAVPEISMISSHSGDLITEEAADADYWIHQPCRPVRWADGLNSLKDQAVSLFLAIGPGISPMETDREPLMTTGGCWVGAIGRDRDEFEQMVDHLGRLYTRGATIDWQGFYKAQTHYKVALPTYPFERERYWVGEGYRFQAEPSTDHPLLGVMDPRMSLNHGVVFKKTLGQNSPIVRDHHVCGYPFFPGTGYLELAHAAGVAVEKDVRFTMSRIRWRKPLTITAERKEIQVRIRKDDRHLNWEVCSENRGETIVHAGGELHPAENDGPEQRISIDEIKARCPHEADGNSLYHQFRQNGLNYGFYYQGIHQAWMNTDEALSLIRLPDVFEPELKTFTFHPAILDAALQIIAGLRDTVQSPAHRPYVPFSLEQIEIYQPLPATCYAYVKAAGPRRYHVAVTDEIGRVCVKFHDIALRELPDPLEAFFYLPRWTPKPLSLPPGNATDVPERQTATLAVSDERKTLIVYRPDSADLLKALESLHPKGRVLKIKLGKRNRRYSERHWEVNPSDAKGLNRWVEKCEAIQSVWFLGGIRYEPADPDSLEALEEEQELGVLSFFRLIQSMIRNGLLHPLPEITVLTDTVHPVRSADRIRPWSSSLCGLSKVLAREYSDLPIRCIDICMEELPAQPTRRQVQEFLSPVIAEPFQTDALSEISIRDGNRFVRIIEPIQLPPVYPPPFKKRGIYLVLGGAGGIGRVMSRYLAQTVEARLAWIGRSALDAEQQDVISRIETLGGEVFHVQADAGDMESMREAVSKIKKRFGRIDGVFHSAIVLKDKALYNMDEESFREALDPKVRGSLILYTVLKDEPLDFLAFFSSAESLIVNAGQGNYAAACTFKDSFAHHLSRRLNFPVKIINWGYWGRVGVVAADEYNRRMTSAGYGCVEPDDGTDALSRVLAHPVTQIMPLKAESHLLESAGIDGSHCLTLYPQNLPSLIHAAVSRVQSPRLGKKKRRHWERAWHELNRFGRHLLLNVFQQMGIFHHGGQHLEKKILRNRLGIIPEYNRLFEALLNILAQAGWIRNGKTALHTLEALDSLEIHQEIERLGEEYLRLVPQYPDMTAHFHLLKACIDAYPEVLTGARRHMEVMFPGGSKSLVEGIYKEEPVTVYANRLLAVLLRQYLRERQAATPGTPLQIIEVGAGTGGTSRFVLEAIKDHPGPLRYFYTDISRGFTEYGRQTLGDEYAFVEFITFNIEAPLEDQGLNPDSADLVFGTNVVHATRSVENTVNQLKRLLKANGLLILNEITQAQDFYTLTFGLTGGWWRYEEPNLRVPYSPLLTADKWQQVLKTSGFRNIHLMGLPEESQKDWKQGIIVGESDGLIRVETEPFLLEDEPSEESEEDAEPFDTTIPVTVSSTALDRFHPAESDPAENLLKEKTRDYLKTVLSEVLKSNKSRIDSRTTFERYGVDSLVTLEITKRLEKDFGRLPATLLFENMTVEKLSDFLFDFHGSRLEEIFKTPAGTVHTDAPFHSEEPKTVTSESLPPYPEASASEKRIRMISGERRNRQSERWSDQDIAVIGLYGRYPLAEDLRTFWVQLKNGKSGIRQVPETRWDWRRYFESEGNEKKAGIYSKWGGFIEDADKFDPHFFKISPREARSMDPQERIFLEAAWAVIEDAGYTIQRLLRDGRDIGTFVGVMNGNYEWLSGEAYAKGSLPEAQSAYWSIANRISYLFDFQGPSLAVDTACSSSLTAVHLACECIRKGDCRMAVAGGVNLILHPMHFQRLCRLGMLSRDAKCKSFGVGADGFVDGEGVGTVLLRPLDDALAHGDQIYGIIKGSGINAGGKTGGFTVPNPNAQSDLIVSAILKAGIDPETVTCIEAHGTGTELGDPIEVAGLTRAFRTYTSRTGYCSLGSVKSNIGHLESAAGIAGLTKVLLQMKHRQLVPSLNSEKINPHLRLEESPFYVQQHLADWPQPVVMDENGEKIRLPRRAGVSSFGAGGANAHLILEEFQESEFKVQSSKFRVEPQLIVLSAKNEDRLREYAKRMVKFLDSTLNSERLTLNLYDIAYTLQMGREAMEERLAMVVSDLAELKTRLSQFIEGQSDIENCFHGSAVPEKNPFSLVLEGDAGEAFLKILSEKRDLLKMARLWVSGAEFDWAQLTPVLFARRISLPTYPFERERYWIVDTPDKTVDRSEAAMPLIDRMDPASSLDLGLSFRKRFTRNDPIIRDHYIHGRHVLPGVAYLEMAHQAMSYILKGRRFKLLRGTWLRPFSVPPGGADAVISVRRGKGPLFNYEIEQQVGRERMIHARGEIEIDAIAGEDRISIGTVQSKALRTLEGSEFYEILDSAGLRYGPYFRGIEKMWWGEKTALSRISLPSPFQHELAGYVLHPSLADCAMQTIAAIASDSNLPEGSVLVPFELGAVEPIRPLPSRGYAHAKSLGRNRFAVDITDASGRVCVRFHDVVLRAMGSDSKTYFYRPVWHRFEPTQAPPPFGEDATPSGGVLIVSTSAATGIEDAVKRWHPGRPVFDIRLGTGDGRRKIQDRVNGALEEIEDLQTLYIFLDRPFFTEPIQETDFHGRDRPSGVLTLFRLVKALGGGRLSARPLDLRIITTDVYDPSRNGILNPEAAAIAGLARTIANEYLQLRVCCSDFSRNEIETGNSGGPDRELLDQAFRSTSEGDGLKEMAVRNGNIHIRRLESIRLIPENPSPFKTNGVYLILGGAGRIGYELSEHLARTVAADLIWIGRRPHNDEIKEKIVRIHESGGNVRYLQADAGDVHQVQSVVRTAKSHFGFITGAVHAAVIEAPQLLEDMDEETFLAAMAPKIQGSLNLYQALREEPLDFLVFFSSAQSFVGDRGVGGYAAACAFQDGLAGYLNEKLPYPVMSINWGYWRNAYDAADEDRKRLIASLGFGVMTPAEGFDAFQRVLSNRMPQIMPLKADKHLLKRIGVDGNGYVERLPVTYPKQLTQTAASVQSPPVDRKDWDRILAGLDTVNRSGRQMLLKAFQQMGVFLSGNRSYDTPRIRETLGVIPFYHRLYDSLLSVLETEGFIQRDGETIFTRPLLDQPALHRELSDIDLRLQHATEICPELTTHISLLKRCLAHYPEILTGKRSAVEILFPNASMDQIEGIYRGNAVADHFNRCTAEGIRTCIEARLPSLPEGEALRILEVGAGTGGTSGFVLEAVEPYGDRISYDYTDISLGFIRKGKNTFGEKYPYLRFKAFDIETDISDQGFKTGSYDVLLAANVLHATRNMRRTLGNVKRLLKTHGWLVINEITTVPDHISLTFGLLEGWWLFEDDGIRLKHSPLLSLETWERLLKEEGFEAVVYTGRPKQGDSQASQHVVIAESNGEIRKTASSPVAPSPRPASDECRRLRAADKAHPLTDSESVSVVYDAIAESLASVLEIDSREFDPATAYTDFGVDSILSVEIINRLNDILSISLRATDLFNYPTIRELAAHITEAFGHTIKSSTHPQRRHTVAVRSIDAQYQHPRYDEMLEILQAVRSGTLDTDEADRLLEACHGR